MPLVGVREAARLLGVSHPALIKARKSGALEFEPDGRLDTDKARNSEWGKKRFDGVAPLPAGPGRPNGIGTPAVQGENPDPGPREAAPPAGVPESVVIRRAAEMPREDGRRVRSEAEPQPHGGWLKRERAEDEETGESGTPAKIELEKAVLVERAEKLRLENEVNRGTLVDRAEVESATEARFRADAEALMNWPGRVAAEMAAELGLEERPLYGILEKYVRRFMGERAKAVPAPAPAG